MKYITYVFFYAKEMLILSIFLTLCYIISYVFSFDLEAFVITVKIVLPIVFFIMKKMGNHSTLYFLYNLGMRDRTIILSLLFLSIIDVLLLQILLN